jgi:hypothetical protein
MSASQCWTIAPQSGVAFAVERGDVVRIIDPEGEQVSDVVAFNRECHGEWLSGGKSIDYNNTVYLTAGHTLYSNLDRPMLTITRDDVGRHDFLLAPCSQRMFEVMHGVQGHHPSCRENLATNLAPYGISEHQVPTAFNVFMNVEVAADGAIAIKPPLSKAGDCIELRAEMPLIVAATACSSEHTNNGKVGPILVEVVKLEVGS